MNVNEKVSNKEIVKENIQANNLVEDEEMRNVDKKRDEMVLGIDLFFSFFLMVFSVWVYYLAKGIRVPGSAFDAPGIFPRVMAVAIFICAAAIFIKCVKRRAWGNLKLIWEYLKDPEQNSSLIRVIVISLLIIIYGFVLIPHLNYTLASFIFLTTFLLYLKAAKIHNIIIISLVTTYFIAFLFTNVLNIPLP